MIKWYENLAIELNIPMILLDIPFNPDYEVSQAEIDYVSAQFWDAVHTLENLFDLKWSDERFKEVTGFSCRSSRAWLDATAQAKYTPSPFNGFDLLNHMAVMVTARGKEAAGEAMEQLLKEYKENHENGTSTYRGEEKYRVMFEGIACWPYLRATSHGLRDRGINMVTTIYADAFGFDYHSFDEMIAAYCSVPNAINLEKSRDKRIKLCKDNNVEGLLVHTNRSCKLWRSLRNSGNQFRRRPGRSAELLRSTVRYPRTGLDGNHGSEQRSEGRVTMVNEIFDQFHKIATAPRAQMDSYLQQGKKVVLTSPVYTPEEILHSMGFVPMGAWGADVELNRSKEYFPAFLCSIVQSMLELGINGAYKGASAIVIPSLCDTLKTLGENWKYAVKDIPFIPMTYPQHRKPAYGIAYTKAGYERVIHDLEKLGGKFDAAALAESNRIYNRHNQVMRRAEEVLANHPEITAAQRSDLFKSAFFMLKEEHTALVEQLIKELEGTAPAAEKLPVIVSGILTDAPQLNAIMDELGFHIVADDVAAQSRQYRTDVPEGDDALQALAEKFGNMDNCSVLYNVEKPRVQWIVDTAKERNAKGVIVVMTKFCDPEEFDYVMIKKACEKADIPVTLIEVDRQMKQFEQIRTNLETFRDMVNM